MSPTARRLKRLLHHLSTSLGPTLQLVRPCEIAEASSDPVIDAEVAAMHAEPLFQPGFEFTDAMMEQMNVDGAPSGLLRSASCIPPHSALV
eukprot:COSAG06_NODE_5619_length_3356_cov_3.849555_5_plen_91_part_00